jgi:hypothetical protein
MRKYFTLLTDKPVAEIETLVAGHPRAAKVELARAITRPTTAPRPRSGPWPSSTACSVAVGCPTRSRS